ncbi:hypothetical protein ACFW2X_03275 [Streptomyces antibioticus]|uniref:hypothetical protein n=1 Tax=Streptomyces antibioticus TaxID=1890 RepID=UPI0036BEF152
MREVEPARTVGISPGMRRVTLSGERLRAFTTADGVVRPAFESPAFESPGFESPGFESPGFESPGFDDEAASVLGVLPDGLDTLVGAADTRPPTCGRSSSPPSPVRCSPTPIR